MKNVKLEMSFEKDIKSKKEKTKKFELEGKSELELININNKR